MVCAVLFMLCGAVCVFPQNEMTQRGSIPQELLRPRREEALRYPVDTVIGELGRGQAPPEAYETAQKIAAALLAGTMNVSILSSVDKVFLESCMAMLEIVNPRTFRLGGGREEPDGSLSFLVRFVGREQGITGELFIRLEEIRSHLRTEPPISEIESEAENEDISTEPESEDETISTEQIAELVQEPLTSVSVQKVWLFEDLILEEPRSRETENSESRHRFDFPPYERFF